jgi:hypothetical protein
MALGWGSITSAKLISVVKSFNFTEPHRPKLTLKIAILDMDTKEMLTAQIC